MNTRDLLYHGVETNENKGSTTCVLAKLDESKADTMQTTNLGDSGYLIFRPNDDGGLEQIFMSEDQ